MTKIFFVKDLPSQKEGHYVHFYFQKFNSPMIAIDLKSIINQNIDSWMDDLNDWFHLICQKNSAISKVWWTMNSSRIIAWDPPIFQPLYFAVSIIKYLEKNPLSELYIVGAPAEVAQYLQEFQPKLMINNHSELLHHQSKKRFLFLKTLIFFMVKLYLRSFKNIGYLIPKKQKFDKLIYSQIINPVLFKESGDHFFGKMFINDKAHNLFIYLGNLKTLELEDSFAKELTSQGKTTVVVQKILNPLDTVIYTLRLIPYFTNFLNFKNNINECKIGNLVSKKFSEVFIEQMKSSIVPFTELEISLSIKKLMNHNSFNSVIFPFEDKALERTILMDIEAPVKTIGFAHAVHNRGHLYLKEHSLPHSNPPRPDTIACTGPDAKIWLRNYGHITKSSLEVFGSPRYRENTISHLPGNKLKLLFMVGTGYEVLMLANLVEENHHIFDGHEFGIKVYPHNMHDMQKEGIARIQKLIPHFKVFNTTLYPAIDWCDVALFASTSAGIEAVLSGKIGIFVQLSHIVPMNPIEGRSLANTIFDCENNSQLGEVIVKISKFSEEEFKNKSLEQRKDAEKIYSRLRIF